MAVTGSGIFGRTHGMYGIGIAIDNTTVVHATAVGGGIAGYFTTAHGKRAARQLKLHTHSSHHISPVTCCGYGPFFYSFQKNTFRLSHSVLTGRWPSLFAGWAFTRLREAACSTAAQAHTAEFGRQTT
jgi:hypothetical protein